MEYHLFQKKIKTGTKERKAWYYWYRDPVKDSQIQKVCKNCRTKWEAELFVQKLPVLTTEKVKISEIAADMYLPGGSHWLRRQQLGESVKINTLVECRRFIGYIIKAFGNYDIRALSVSVVMSFLVLVKRSASWKNQFLICLSEIYKMATWNGIILQKPSFPRFKGNVHKSDVFTRAELQKFLIKENFPNDDTFYLFLLTAAAGLRISEARGFRSCQMLKDNQMVLVDGFLDRGNKIRNNYNKKGSAENPKWRLSIINRYSWDMLLDFIHHSPRAADEILFRYNDLPIRIEYLGKVFERALKKSGLKDERKLTMHSLRYSYVTNMRSVLDGDVVRKMVGHTSMQMTDYYTRPGIDAAADSLRPFVDDVNDFFE